MSCIFKNVFLLSFNTGNIKGALLKLKLRSLRFIATSQRAISPKTERIINIRRGVRFALSLIAPIFSLRRKKLSLDAESSNRLKGMERNYINIDISAEKNK